MHRLVGNDPVLEGLALELSVSSSKSRLFHVGAIAERVKHALNGVVEKGAGDARLLVRLKDDVCNVSLVREIHQKDGVFCERVLKGKGVSFTQKRLPSGKREGSVERRSRFCFARRCWCAQWLFGPCGSVLWKWNDCN